MRSTFDAEWFDRPTDHPNNTGNKLKLFHMVVWSVKNYLLICMRSIHDAFNNFLLAKNEFEILRHLTTQYRQSFCVWTVSGTNHFVNDKVILSKNCAKRTNRTSLSDNFWYQNFIDRIKFCWTRGVLTISQNMLKKVCCFSGDAALLKVSNFTRILQSDANCVYDIKHSFHDN